jgi:hypothetical protein
MADLSKPGSWRDRAGLLVLDPEDPHGNPLDTPLDRRWLWRLEGRLAVEANTGELRRLADDLRQYLDETCEHHWLDYDSTDGPADDPRSQPFRQCLWCCSTEFKDVIA